MEKFSFGIIDSANEKCYPSFEFMLNETATRGLVSVFFPSLLFGSALNLDSRRNPLF